MWSATMMSRYPRQITTITDMDKPTPEGIEALVCADIAERQQKGLTKYRVSVADNPLSLREWLEHAYQECLDQAIYLRRAISEIDNTMNTPPDKDDHTVPVIPPRKPEPQDLPNQPIAKCGACGLLLYNVMGFVCPRADCPCFPKVTC